MSRRVTIGLPTYNRADLLQKAVESLQVQTHRDIEILISDNASPDPRVEVLLKDLAKHDARIKYVRRPSNDGAAINFRSVLSDVTTPYFMWASDDDVWDPHFVERCLDLLESNPCAQMAFGSIDNIGMNGETVRTYEGFSKYSSVGDVNAKALRFVAEPEIFGKANLIYGLFRAAPIQRLVDECWDDAGFDQWGGDVVLMFAFISRYPIVVVDDVLLHKRIQPSQGIVVVPDPDIYVLPPLHFNSLIRRFKAVAPDRAVGAAAAKILRRRLIGEVFRAVRRRAFWSALAHVAKRRLRRLVDFHRF